jgi:hypothetical protein
VARRWRQDKDADGGREADDGCNGINGDADDNDYDGYETRRRNRNSDRKLLAGSSKNLSSIDFDLDA